MGYINTIIFDLGGVLIDWNPRYLYKNIFNSDIEMEYFLSHICTSEWNEEQDGGRSFEEATQILQHKHPEYSNEIAAFYGRWEEMLNGPIEETVALFKELKETNNYKIVALTNWSAESFPLAKLKFDFLEWFDGILVSGEEKLKKPDPKIFNLLCDRYDIIPAQALFIDDNKLNIRSAQNLGFNTIHFKSPSDCQLQLNNFLG